MNPQYSAIINRITRNKLLLLPVLLLTVIRVAGGAWIYIATNAGNGGLTHWAQPNSQSATWPLLFQAWDSTWYVSIAQKGYSHPAFAFLPAYPILIRLAESLTGDYWIAAFLISSFFALASLVVFQLLANEYMGKTEAAFATVLMATFPYVALFTTLAYSEALFLFCSLSSWYFFRRKRMLTASLLAAVTALTRSYGILIILPMILDMVRSRNYRRGVYLAIPLLALLSWAVFCFLATGDPLASWTDENYWRSSGIGFGVAQEFLLRGFSGVSPIYFVFDPVLSLLAISLFAYLLVNVWKIDKALWLYAAALFAALLFAAPIMSLPRYLAFIFPIWLTARTRGPLAIVFCVCFFVPVLMIMWLSILQGAFIA